MIEHETDQQSVDSGVVDATVEAPPESTIPGVDELENRLRDLQGAMDQIQKGDLDAAEEAIEALEQRLEAQRD